MSNNYFAIERNGECWSNVVLVDLNGIAFEEFLDMTYSEMIASDKRDDFILACMMAIDRKTGTEGDQTVVTLIDENGVFIWGIIMDQDTDDESNVRCVFVDWKKDGKSYRYES